MMTRGGRGVKNAKNLMTSYVNDPLVQTEEQIRTCLFSKLYPRRLLASTTDSIHLTTYKARSYIYIFIYLCARLAEK